MKMWVGQEREGNLKGTKTLFIGDPSITINDINDAAKHHTFSQIYFGAGVCSKINYGLVTRVEALFPKHIITLEIDYKEFDKVREEFINSRVNFILTISDKGFSRINHMFKDRIQIKVQSLDNMFGGRFLAISKITKFDIVDLSELRKKTYKGDKVLK